jgi:ribosomal protein S18 acetylase RimI-like enzyme
MSPAEAGANAAKMMLYYAILRCRTARESQRAIALYNSYGFGYALGMNFRNPQGKREMLWPQDLDEILLNGQNKNGCKIV